MTRKNEEQDKLPAKALASASSDTLPPRAAAPQDPEYPAPTVSEASNNVLSPLDVLHEGIHVKVTYESMSPNDVIALIFNGEDTFVPQYGNDTKAVIFTVGSSHVAKALGEDILVKYVINGVDGGIISESLTLTILPLMEEDMTIIKIPQATESTPGKLDLSTFTGDAEFIIPPWPVIAEGQLVWLDMISESSTQHFLNAYPVTLDEVSTGITRPIRRSLLETTPDGSLLEFAQKVQFNGSGSANGARPFPALKLLLQHNGGGSGDIVEDFETYASGDKPSPFDAKGMTITGTNLSVIGAAGGRALKATVQRGKADIKFSFIGHYKRATIDLRFDIAGDGRLICTYKDGDVDERVISGTDMQHYEFSHDDISSFQVTAVYDGWQTRVTIENIKLYAKASE
jgi:hypothetical protein